MDRTCSRIELSSLERNSMYNIYTLQQKPNYEHHVNNVDTKSHSKNWYVIESVICDPNFEGLVLGCIEADFCNQVLVGKLLTRCIRLMFLCTAPLAKFQRIFVELFGGGAFFFDRKGVFLNPSVYQSGAQRFKGT